MIGGREIQRKRRRGKRETDTGKSGRVKVWKKEEGAEDEEGERENTG